MGYVEGFDLLIAHSSNNLTIVCSCSIPTRQITKHVLSCTVVEVSIQDGTRSFPDDFSTSLFKFRPSAPTSIRKPFSDKLGRYLNTYR